jgi:hypothetical protein
MDREEELESLFKMDLDSSLRSLDIDSYDGRNERDSSTLQEVVVVLFYTIMEGGIGRAASQILI